MKIFLKGRYLGKVILEAFGKCGPALQNGSPYPHYQLVPTLGDFEGISIGPFEVIQGQGAQLVPKIPVYTKRYIFFGPKIRSWEESADLKIHLKSIFPDKEYDTVNIVFLGAERNDDGDLKEAVLFYGEKLFEKYRISIGKFLGAFADNLKG